MESSDWTDSVSYGPFTASRKVWTLYLDNRSSEVIRHLDQIIFERHGDRLGAAGDA